MWEIKQWRKGRDRQIKGKGGDLGANRGGKRGRGEVEVVRGGGLRWRTPDYFLIPTNDKVKGAKTVIKAGDRRRKVAGQQLERRLCFSFLAFLYFQNVSTFRGQLLTQRGIKIQRRFLCLHQQATSGDKLPSFASHLHVYSNSVCCVHMCVCVGGMFVCSCDVRFQSYKNTKYTQSSLYNHPLQ